MSNTVEFDLARLTAQSSGPNPKEPGGGLPQYTRQEILACLAEVPHASFYCLLAKYCGDEQAERQVLKRIRRMSIKEWFDNPEHTTKRIEAGQLKKLAEVAVLAWINPRAPHGASQATRAAYIGAAEETYRRNFQDHFSWITGELQYLESLGARIYMLRKYGRRNN
jgi:hypothetical protein